MGLLDVADGLICGNHAGQLEEAGLHDHVDAAAHARLAGHGECVDRVKLDILVQDLLLHAGGQRVPHLVRRMRAVHQEGGVVGGVLQEIEQVQQGGLVQGRKFALVIRYVDLIGRGPKRRWEMVEEPDFLESYTK